MNFLASLFVAKPFNVLMVSVVFLGTAFMLRWFGIVRQRRHLIITSMTWGLYAVWEWLVQMKTPEANIRVDLLVIWPLLATITVWALYRVCRH